MDWQLTLHVNRQRGGRGLYGELEERSRDQVTQNKVKTKPHDFLDTPLARAGHMFNRLCTMIHYLYPGSDHYLERAVYR